MSLAELSIRRPVLAVVMSILIVLFGGVGFSYLGVREYPAVDPPIITVSTTYTGAAPDVIESQITEPLEQAINGIDGIRIISSTSSEGRSNITVEFNLDANLETAANDVRDKVSIARRNLPIDADPPVVEKADADATPIIYMVLQSDSRSLMDLSDLASTLIKERVQTIPSVSGVRIFGEKKYSMRLWMDPIKMAANRITPLDVQTALSKQNVDLPAGRIEGDNTELGIRTDGRLTQPDEFNRMILKEENGRILEFGDIGTAELAPEDLRSGTKTNLVPSVGVAVQPQPGANAIAIADEFFKRLESIKKELPPDVKAEIGFDFTKYIRRSVEEVNETLLIAFLLVALIIYLFLRDWRSTLIPVIAIPVSIVSAFFIMYAAGFSINVLTMVGIVLAIGLVCDDAIVVLENIYAKVEQGMTPFDAAIAGSKEIYFAVISTTITLAAVFLPIIFLSGLTGRLFREFGVVVAGSVLVSAFVALTLSPMMCAYLLKHQEKPGWFYRVTEPFFQSLTRNYRVSLEWFMARRWMALPIVAATVALIFIIGTQLSAELAPFEDRSNIRIQVKAPEGATYEYTRRYMDEIAEYIAENVPEASRYVSNTGGGNGANTGTQNIYLVDAEERTRTQAQIFQQLARDATNFTGVRAFPNQPPTIGSRGAGQPVQYVLQAPSLAAMTEVLPKFLEETQKNQTLRFVDSDLKVNKPEIQLRINRQKASELGISVQDVARTLQLSLSGTRFGYFIMNGKQYQVIGQLQRGDRDAPLDLNTIFVRTAAGEMASLDNLIDVRESVSPTALYRFNRYVSATVSAGLAPGKTIGDGIKAMDEAAAKVLPDNFSTSLTGQARDYADSSSSLLFAFALALVLIYLVLAAQFESFIDPLIILLTVPMSLAGAVGSLWIFGQTLNIFSEIGIIMLIGLVTKNGILIVEFANQRKEEGLKTKEAAVESALARFRPILMTTLATILGVLPIALSLGGAAGSRQSLGIAVVGGLLFSGFLTLYIVPAIYTYLSVAKPDEQSRLTPSLSFERSSQTRSGEGVVASLPSKARNDG